jgi:copper chaperone CopZ
LSYYMHNVPGRLRVKTPVIKGKELMAARIEGEISAIGGVTAVATNTVTGSIVINYDPLSVTHKAIVGELAKKGYFDYSKAVTNDQYVHTAAHKAGRAVSKAVFGVAVDLVFEGSALSLLSALL